MITSPNLPLISNYKAIKLLHESDRTLVYRSHNEESGQSVVIKLMGHEYPSFNELVQFRNQYIIAKNLEIEGVVKAYALERYENRYALIMEDVEGISLADYKGRNPLPLSQFFNIAIQLADILHQLHRDRIIHKDIKPANILIQPRTQQIKLIDFSISTLLPKETQTIKTPNVLEGTLAYLAPEQTGRMNRGIDYRSDFYALGVTLYELLAGRLPFSSDDPMELVHAHIAQQPIPPCDWLTGEGENNPQSLSDIILKLMAKNAEDRYQSALGLKHDLEKCQSQWQARETSETFHLGERDTCDRFLIPEKLYGREAEVAKLLAAFERVASPQTPLSKGESPPPPLSKGGEYPRAEMMLVAGFSGIGKTAVINEVHKPIVEARGYFIKGKFDQFNRNIPFSAFMQAFRDLMGQLLGESDRQLQGWKTKILAAVGVNGQVLIDAIPELEQVIGKQPEAPELSGNAAQNRFNLLFEKFIAVFTTKEHPLTLFLDDLQWADSASLNLLKVLMENDRARYLLLLGAYRDNEVFPAHPLMLTLGALERKNTTISTITLAPLSVGHINRLVAETLSCTADLARPLTDIVYQKTQGNPFFTTQFLKGLHEDGLITFNPHLRYWECDLVQVREAALTDDVVAFMAGRLHKLPEQTQNRLKLAACIGNQFNLETLAIICETSSEEVAANLWSALREGLILPQSQAYKFFQGWEKEDSADSITVTYRFLHDRVQQAAYTLIPEAQKQIAHLKIGKRLLENTSENNRDEKIFTIVNQLNYGSEYLDTTEERHELACLNAIAARKARAATAYQAGREYAKMGLSLLGDNAWEQQYTICLEFHEIAAELASLCGDFEAMERYIETAIARANAVLDRVNVYRIRIQFYISQNKPTEAIAIGQQFLKQLGIAFPEAPTQEDIQQAVGEIGELMKDRDIQDLVHLPRMSDREKIAIVQIASSIISAASIAGSPLFPLAVALSVKLSIQYGNTLASALAYVCYGIFACKLLQDVNTGVQFGQLALKIASQPDTKVVKPEVLFVAGFYILHRQSHLKEALSPIRDGYALALEVGNQEYAGYSAQSCCLTSFWCGQPLAALEQETGNYCNALMQLNQLTTANWCRIYWQVMLNLLGSGENPGILSGTALKEAEFLTSLTSARDLFGLYLFYLYKLILSYLFGDIESAQSHAIEVRKYLVSGAGSLGEAAFYFYDSLTELAGLSIHAEGISEVLERVEQNQAQLQEQWARYAPMNHQHKVDLVAAEKYRVLGEKVEAIEMYDKAILGAKENEYIQEEALGNELAAKFYLEWGKETIAEAYMQKAYYGYAQWGAKAKVKDIEDRYSQLLSPILAPQSSIADPNARISTQKTRTLLSTSVGVGEMLDLSSLMKASRTLSREIDRDRAIANLMQVIQENAGAQTVALMLLHEDTLILEAKISDGQNQSPESCLVEENQNIPRAIVNTVKRTRTPLLLDNAAEDKNYARDEYIKNNQSRSILCLPLLNSEKLIGILVLENNRTIGAFTSDRVEVLRLLCAQAAITLENTRLYQQAQQALQLERELHDLQQTQLTLIQSEKMFSLGQMVAGIAHEINNPINFIHGNVVHASAYINDILELLSLYQEAYPQAPDNIQRAIEAIDLPFLQKDLQNLLKSMRTGSDRIKTIITSLRTFARLDEAEWKGIDIRAGIESTLTILQTRLQEKEQREAIQVIKEYGNLPLVECYAGQLNQVLLNVLNNAIDALEECGRQNALTCHIRTEMDGKEVKIIITDNGIGMSDEARSRLFDPFFTTKPVGKGTGLGMAIAHQIITEKHGGAIACQSELGKGTEFIIFLPLEPS